LIAINTALMAVVFAWAKEGSAFNYDRTTTFTGRNGHFQGQLRAARFATPWQRRTNVWRKITKPGLGAKATQKRVRLFNQHHAAEVIAVHAAPFGNARHERQSCQT
jgi:hypothetical protein